MASYLIVSVFSGFACALGGVLGYDAGFWAAILFYFAGNCAGFIVSVALFLLLEARRGPSVPHWQEHPAVR